jgi:hypothetical protein
MGEDRGAFTGWHDLQREGYSSTANSDRHPIWTAIVIAGHSCSLRLPPDGESTVREDGLTER